MANTPTKVLFKRNSTANTPPTADRLVPGEIALNTADGKIFLKTDAGNIVDTSKQIFQRDTNVTVTDDGATDQYVITSVDGQQKIKIDASSAQLDADLVMAGGQVISLYDLANSGKISIEAPSSVPLDYTLKLPVAQGTAGQMVQLGENGQLDFVAPDQFGGNRVYVSADRGDDANDGVNAPVKTLKRAAQIASRLIYEHRFAPEAGAANARDLLFKNKEFIKEEVAAYISTTYPLFTYGALGVTAGAEKSKRDAGLILDAAIFDMYFSGNEKTREYGLSFYNGSATYLLANEKAICVDALEYAKTIAQQIITNTTVTSPYQTTVTQYKDVVNPGLPVNATVLAAKYDVAIGILENGIDPTYTYTQGVDYDASAIVYLGSGFNAIVIEESKFTNPAAYANILSKLTGQGWTITGSGVTTATITQNQDWANYFPGAKLASITPSLWETSDWISASPINITSISYTVPTVALETGLYRLRGVSIRLAPGNYFENNPIIIPDVVSVIGDDLRSAVVRPLNANKDLFRIRNATYMNGFTFRDHVTPAGFPDFTWRYTHAFDDVYDTEVERTDYTWISNAKPIISASPYIQNCSIISFLGGSGCLIDGSKVDSPNVPTYQIEAENPAVGDVPEQGKSMVGNAYTMLTFGGTGWHVINDAYSQIVSCFQIFCLNGVYAQSGGYISVTNSATNFGGFALRSSGYSTRSFTFDRGVIAGTGVTGGAQTVTVVGTQRLPLIQYVMRVTNPTNGNDITDSFKASPVNIDFDSATALTLGSSVFTINNHGLFTGNKVYYQRNGNPEISGMSDNAVYHVQVANINQFILYNDESFQYQEVVNAPGTGTHRLVKNQEEFFVSDVLDSHSTYQKLTLAGSSYTFTPGRAISGVVDIYDANAYVHSWNPSTKELIISNEYTTIDGNNERVKFTNAANSYINQDHASPANVGPIAIASVQDYTGLYTCTFFPKSTIEGGTISSISGLLLNNIAFHRPSIVNSSAHTWEYAGSGTDYNALPQNGGLPKPAYEQYEELPGRVYTSGTNELGDFKVGNFIIAENRSGLITFKSKVTVGELNVLKLTLSSVAINQISADVGLGDNEPGGASNQRLSTQKAVRSFLANRLGSVIDKGVSTNAVPGALVQLNASGQINADLIPPQKTATTYQVSEWGGRLYLYDKIPAVDVQISDQANERYDQQTLTLSGTVTATIGQVVTQDNRTGTGVVKFAVTGSNSVTIANASGLFSTNSIDTIFFDGVDSGEYPTNTGTAVEQSDTYYLAVDNKSQYLTLGNGNWSFTNGNTVKAVDNLAEGTITNYKAGVLHNVDNTGIFGGLGYNPGLYYDVPLVTVTGSGTGAKADITITGSVVTNVAVNFGGNGYAVGDELSANTADIGGGIPTNTFTVDVSSIKNQLYVDITGSNIKFTASNSDVDYIEDNNAPVSSITDLTDYAQKSFIASSIPGGAVDYNTNRITISSHGYTNGDPVIYSSGVNTAIGNLVSNTTYYVKVIDSSTLEIYQNYNLATKIIFGLPSSGTHTFARYVANTDSFTFVVPSHGYTTGTPVKITGATPPGGITSGEYYYIGSVTTNSFTLHELQSDALLSINGTSYNVYAITSSGAGSLDLTTQNVQINGVVNTSSKTSNNWNNLTATTIDASAIVSGTVSPTRLANTGNANNQTFLRGDSSWAYATASAKPATGSPVTIVGDFDTRNGINYYHGDLTFDIDKVDPLEGGANFTNYGVAAFSKTQFTVVDGQVTITAGSIDAGQLGGFTGSYYLTPSNFIDTVPITKGGTGLTTYTKGDLLFAPSNNTVAQLNIGSTGQILTADVSGIPQWASDVSVPGTVTAQSTTQSTSTTTGSLITGGGAGIAKNLYVGGSASVAGDITGTGGLSVTGTDKNVNLSPQGTGVVTINPATKGTINNVDIGSSTRGSAAFTTLAANGNTTVTSNTASTNTTSGALVVTGGTGIGGNLNVGGNTVIAGDLTVNGTTTTVNSTTVTIEDPIIDIGGGVNGAAPTTNDSKDRGIKFQWHNGTTAKTGFFGYKSADGYLEFIPDATITGDVASGTLGDIKAGTFRGNLVSASATITGGSIYGTPVGVENAAAGAFTTLTANDTVTFTKNTTSVDTTTGTLVVTGGVGISGAVNSESLGTGAITATGNLTANGANATISFAPTGTGSVVINPATLGSINKMSIGQTVADAGRFTELKSTNLTQNSVLFAGASGLITQDTGFTYNATSDTLAVSNLTVTSVASTNLTATSLTGGRVTYATTGGVLSDDAEFTYNPVTDTLSVTNITNTSVVSTNVTVSSLTEGRLVIAGSSGLLDDIATLYVSGTALYAASIVTGDIDASTLDATSNVTVGGTLGVTGNATLSTVSSSGQATLESVEVTNDATVGGNLDLTGNLNINGTKFNVVSASGNTNIGGSLDVKDTTQTTSTTTGSIITAGGVGVAKNVFVGGNINVSGTATVSSTFNANATSNLNPANNNVSIQPTGTGTVTINPATAGSIENMVIGASVAKGATFTTLTTTGNTTLNGSGSAINITPTGLGTVTINPGTTGAVDNMIIGASTARSGTFTNLTANTSVSLSPSGTVTINPTVLGSINNINIGSSTRGSGAFTTLAANGAVTFTATTQSTATTDGALIIGGGVGIDKNTNIGGDLRVTGAGTITGVFSALNTVNLNPSNANVSIQPTGTGSVTVNPTVTGNIDNMIIGATTATSATFTALTTTGTVSMAGTDSTISINPTGLGTVTINPATKGTVNNMDIGATTAGTGRFTTLTATTSVTLSPTGVVTINPSTTGSINNVNIGTTTRGSGAFTTLAANGLVTSTDTTESTNTTSGSIVTSGGVGIAKNLNVGGNAVITGNLTVNGTTTTVNSIISTVQDPIIDIGGVAGGGAPTSDDSKDRGITFQYFDTSAKRGFFGYDDITGYFKYIADASLSGEVATGNLGDIQAGTFRGNVVGDVGEFNTITANSVSYNDTTQSTDVLTGSIITAGGVGIAKNLNVGGEAQFGLELLNALKIVGSQAGDPVIISSVGGDTNVNIRLEPQGVGIVEIDAISALKIPVGLSTDRPINPVSGLIRFNTTTTQFEGHNGIGWSSLGGVRDVAGTTFIVPELTPGSDDKTLYFYADNIESGTWDSDRLTVKTKGFRIPAGVTSERPTGVAGDIRFNTETTQFEGYSGISWASLGGTRSSDGQTYIIAESAPGANDDTLYFYANNQLRAKVTTGGLTVDNINLFGNTVKAIDTNGNLILKGDGSGVVVIQGTGALQIPAGTSLQRPGGATPSGVAGYIRYNTSIRQLEVWDQIDGVYKTVGGGTTTDLAGDTKITFETEGNNEKIIRFYVGAGQPEEISQGSVEIAKISKTGFLVSDKINIFNNVIENIVPDEDLIIRANGTGRVVLDGAGGSGEPGNVFATDPLLTLNSKVTSTNTYDSGIIINRGSDTNTGFIWSEAGGEFRAISTTETGTILGSVVVDSYKDVAVASVKLNSETTGKITFTDDNKVIRTLDSGRTAHVAGNLVVDTTGQFAVPVDTLQNRPVNAIEGSFRFNTTAGIFEGYAQGGWQAMGVTQGTAPSYQGFIASGESNFVLDITPLNAAGIIVIADGEVLEPGYSYQVTGNVLNILDTSTGLITTPANGTRIDVRHISKPSISSIKEFKFVGDGNTFIYESDYHIATKAEVLIFVNNTKVDSSAYDIADNSVILNFQPTLGDNVTLIHFCTIIAPDIATKTYVDDNITDTVNYVDQQIAITAANATDDAIAFAIALG